MLIYANILVFQCLGSTLCILYWQQLLLLLFWNRASLHSLSFLATHKPDLPSNSQGTCSPTSASWVLGLMLSTTTQGSVFTEHLNLEESHLNCSHVGIIVTLLDRVASSLITKMWIKEKSKVKWKRRKLLIWNINCVSNVHVPKNVWSISIHLTVNIF